MEREQNLIHIKDLIIFKELINISVFSEYGIPIKWHWYIITYLRKIIMIFTTYSCASESAPEGSMEQTRQMRSLKAHNFTMRRSYKT